MTPQDMQLYLSTTDFLPFFAFGLVADYAVELSLAAGRARRQAA
jgi:hypothetical protein